MSDKLKFPVESSKLICNVLKDGIERLELVRTFPLNESEFGQREKPVCHSIFDTETFIRCRDIQSALNKEKLSQDCQRVYEILCNVHDELDSSQTFSKLTDYVDECVKELLDLQTLMENHRKQKTFAENLKKMFATREERERREEADLINESFQTAEMHYQHEMDLSVETKYVESWFQSQLRQKELALMKSEEEANKELLETTIQKFATENVSFKICKFYRQRIKELQDENTKMSAEYFIQLENYEMEFEIATKIKKDLDLMIQTEQENFAQRDKEMIEYQLKKRQKETDKKLLDLQQAKAIVIQAWWRGVMVRQFLGRFKAFKKRARQMKKKNKGAAKKNKGRPRK